MIAHLRGKPVLTGDRWVVIDVGGIGFQVQVTQPALQLMVNMTEPVQLFTYMAVREDAIRSTVSCTRVNWRCSGS